MKDKKLIGLTGVYCAGKNYVAVFLEQRGLPVLDVDKLGHQVIEMEKERIMARFGSDILGEDGLIDRKRLGARVFGKPAELAVLENIVHPGANRETVAWIKAREEKTCVINAALLHRSSVFNELDAVIIVKAPWLARILRARKRDNLPWTELIKRFRSQSEFNTQYFTKNTDIYRVENSGYFGVSKGLRRNRLENRIDEILSLLGIK